MRGVVQKFHNTAEYRVEFEVIKSTYERHKKLLFYFVTFAGK